MKNNTLDKSKPYDIDPTFQEYINNGWVEMCLDGNGKAIIVDGMPIYQIINAEQGIRMSRLLKYNHIMSQAEVFGLTREGVDFNFKMIEGLSTRIRDSRNNPDEVDSLCNQLNIQLHAFKEVRRVGMDDELILSISAVWYLFPTENPTKFDDAFFLKKIDLFRKANLSVFFYTSGLRILAGSLQMFVEDFQSFMTQMIVSNIENLKMTQLNLIEYLNSTSTTLSDEQFGYLEKQIMNLQERMSFLRTMQLISI